VFCDLIEALVCHSVAKDNWNTQISIRLWEDKLKEHFEFRCFVHENTLVAISQYNHYCVYPVLIDKIKELHRIITDYCNHVVIPRLSKHDVYSSGYIVDVGVIGDVIHGVSGDGGGGGGVNDDDGLKCVVIELNPYKQTTGAALFDWTNDRDILFSKQPNVRDEGNCSAEAMKEETCVMRYDDRTQCFEYPPTMISPPPPHTQISTSRVIVDNGFTVLAPPMRVRGVPMIGLSELVSVMMEQTTDANEAKAEHETFLQVLEKFENEMKLSPAAAVGGGGAENLKKTGSVSQCSCQ
jgi:hypothetical protein